MPKEKAQEAFQKAHQEHFNRTSLFSFYFAEGWMEFVLEFDEQSRLRRMFLHHKNIKQERGVEIHLAQANDFSVPNVTLRQRGLTLP